MIRRSSVPICDFLILCITHIQTRTYIYIFESISSMNLDIILKYLNLNYISIYYDVKI